MIYASLILITLNLLLFFFHKYLSKINYPTDRPNQRKIHSGNVLMSGGLFFFVNLIFFLFIKNFLDVDLIKFSESNNENLFFIIAIFFFLLGFIDDKINLNANLKLLLIIIILTCFLNLNKNFVIEILRFSFTDKTLHLGNYSLIFTVLCLALFTNAFNMYDGINLQSGSYSLIFFIFLILNNYNFYFTIFFIFSLILFLIKNFYTKSFLGDSGCYILSFIIGIFIIDFYQIEKIYSDQIFLLMMIPGVDMLRLFVTRIISKKNPFVGDKNHLHHILLNSYGQNKVFQILFAIKLAIFVAVFFNVNSILIFFVIISIYIFFLQRNINL